MKKLASLLTDMCPPMPFTSTQVRRQRGGIAPPELAKLVTPLPVLTPLEPNNSDQIIRFN